MPILHAGLGLVVFLVLQKEQTSEKTEKTRTDIFHVGCWVSDSQPCHWGRTAEPSLWRRVQFCLT